MAYEDSSWAIDDKNNAYHWGVVIIFFKLIYKHY